MIGAIAGGPAHPASKWIVEGVTGFSEDFWHHWGYCGYPRAYPTRAGYTSHIKPLSRDAWNGAKP